MSMTLKKTTILRSKIYPMIGDALCVQSEKTSSQKHSQSKIVREKFVIDAAEQKQPAAAATSD